ncbi:MAG TPA: MOSC N-terminal beta barrel domain-containing protein [Moraxellaceae bacterium]|nr:MOSC N-terminal beta barrel domain-containing protein [Moraxellaceae bacterium]
MRISELAIHPLKSARRLVVPELALDALGPAQDRRWMLVDAAGAFVTQRTHPRLCLLAATPVPGGLQLAAPGRDDLVVPVPDGTVDAAGTVAARVWNDTVAARPALPAAHAWCSDFLGLPVRLLHMPDDAVRAVDPHYAGPGHRTAFSDGFPLLLVTQSSLDHLNRRLAAEGAPAVDWARFRPNVVVAGDLPPHAEDGWRRLRVGEVELALVKPCSRCVIPSIDPATAVKDSRILTILRAYRRRPDGKVYLGQNVVVARAAPGARLRQGDTVEILE